MEFSGNAPLPKELAIYLGDQIIAGKYPRGSQLPTVREFASSFEVGRDTVRLALDELERQGFIYRRVGKGTFVKEVRSSESVTSLHIALVSLKHTNPYSDRLISSLFEGSNRVLSKHQCRFTIHTLEEIGNSSRDANCAHLVNKIKMNPPDGVIFAAEPTVHTIQELSKCCPVIQAGYFIPDVGVGHVGSDMLDGMRKVLGYLLAIGHRKIALISHSTGSVSFPTITARTDVYLHVMKELELSEHILVIDGDEYETTLSRDFSHTAVVTTSTSLGSQILSSAVKYGVNVPSDLSLISYDDAGVGAETEPRYTSIRHLSEHMGEVAAEKLLAVIAGGEPIPVAITYPAELIIRESCAPPRIRNRTKSVGKNETQL